MFKTHNVRIFIYFEQEYVKLFFTKTKDCNIEIGNKFNNINKKQKLMKKYIKTTANIFVVSCFDWILSIQFILIQTFKYSYTHDWISQYPYEACDATYASFALKNHNIKIKIKNMNKTTICGVSTINI